VPLQQSEIAQAFVFAFIFGFATNSTFCCRKKQNLSLPVNHVSKNTHCLCQLSQQFISGLVKINFFGVQSK